VVICSWKMLKTW